MLHPRHRKLLPVVCAAVAAVVGAVAGQKEDQQHLEHTSANVVQDRPLRAQDRQDRKHRHGNRTKMKAARSVHARVRAVLAVGSNGETRESARPPPQSVVNIGDALAEGVSNATRNALHDLGNHSAAHLPAKQQPAAAHEDHPSSVADLSSDSAVVTKQGVEPEGASVSAKDPKPGPGGFVKTKPDFMTVGVWKLYQKSVKLVNRVYFGLSITGAFGLQLNMDILKLAFLGYVHEDEDDYPYLPITPVIPWSEMDSQNQASVGIFG